MVKPSQAPPTLPGAQSEQSPIGGDLNMDASLTKSPTLGDPTPLPIHMHLLHTPFAMQ